MSRKVLFENKREKFSDLHTEMKNELLLCKSMNILKDPRLHFIRTKCQVPRPITIACHPTKSLQFRKFILEQEGKEISERMAVCGWG